VVTGPAGDSTADAFHQAALAGFAPRRVVQRLVRPDPAGPLPAPLQAMLQSGPQPRGYACRGTACSLPAESLGTWRATLASLGPSTG
jgi:hypothetical protein